VKLILCSDCCDIFALTEKRRNCLCDKSGGRYLDDILAEYWGKAIPLGISNPSLVAAVLKQPECGEGEKFEAFVIPKNCDTFKKIKRR
jgi:hypothetical protein